MDTPKTQFIVTKHIDDLLVAHGLTRTEGATAAMRAVVADPKVLLIGLAVRIDKGDPSPIAPKLAARIEPALVQAFRAEVDRLGLPIGAVINLAIEGYLATRQPVNSTV